VTLRRLRRVWRSLQPVVPFLAAALAVLVAIAAIAAPRVHTDTNDPNDTKGVLDVRRVRLAHGKGTEVTVLTFAKWAPPAIWDRGNAFVFLDTQGGPEAEYFILVRSTGGKLHASLWRERPTRRDVFLKNVRVRRKTPDGLSVRIPINAMEFGGFRDSYTWWTVTSFTGEICRRTCIDRAPDDGALEPWRPGHSPTPTTSTPTDPPDD
jgi:hypothetical protein